jgi:hypothetical protein
MSLEVGQRVKFRRSHDKSLELTGRVVKVDEDAGVVDIETEPDGKILEVATTETAHLADVTPIDQVSDEVSEPADDTQDFLEPHE